MHWLIHYCCINQNGNKFKFLYYAAAECTALPLLILCVLICTLLCNATFSTLYRNNNCSFLFYGVNEFSLDKYYAFYVS